MFLARNKSIVVAGRNCVAGVFLVSMTVNLTNAEILERTDEKPIEISFGALLHHLAEGSAFERHFGDFTTLPTVLKSELFKELIGTASEVRQEVSSVNMSILCSTSKSWDTPEEVAVAYNASEQARAAILQKRLNMLTGRLELEQSNALEKYLVEEFQYHLTVGLTDHMKSWAEADRPEYIFDHRQAICTGLQGGDIQ